MSDIPFVPIRVGETLTWGFDWDEDDWLGTETIASSAWTITPSGPTLSQAALATPATSVKITGVEFGMTYALANAITDSSGQVGVRAIVLRCIAP